MICMPNKKYDTTFSNPQPLLISRYQRQLRTKILGFCFVAAAHHCYCYFPFPLLLCYPRLCVGCKQLIRIVMVSVWTVGEFSDFITSLLDSFPWHWGVGSE